VQLVVVALVVPVDSVDGRLPAARAGVGGVQIAQVGHVGAGRAVADPGVGRAGQRCVERAGLAPRIHTF